MTLRSDLAREAEKDPNRGMCHLAVLRWLRLAKIITEADEKVVLDLCKSGSGWGKFLVRREAPLVDQLQLEHAGAGMVVGFWDGQQYQHSMVTTVNGKIAGERNLYVMKTDKARMGYVNIPIHHLAWINHRSVP